MKRKIEIDCKTLDYIKSIEQKFKQQGVDDPHKAAVLMWLNKELKIC